MHERILIIDDDPNIRALLRINLQATGYEVHEAVNGHDALEQVGRTNPQLLILDIMMPEVDGWEVAKIVRDHEGEQIKILMLTARDTQRDRLIGKEILKADEYITKPFDIDELLETVDRLLSK